ncbi:integrase domain-containing protein [Saezia sanguinis]|uniref:integrase domain-containing protein n=1 Tax=Saezia sanguinis TaxID=1965230 RepID=UPI000F8CC6D8|nr:integrase domain-containing protein [Saezia sanguinis]
MPTIHLPHDREEALQAVWHAITIAQTRENKRLIDKPEEKKAMIRYKNVMYAAGFRGKESRHSLRYAFTQRQIEASRIERYDKKDALMLASRDLGHGDGRGRYIKRVYGR